MSESEKEKDQKAKSEVLEKAIKKIETSFGKGSIMILGEETKIAPVEVISTGSLSLDIATGVGGYPKGRIVEIFGPEASGKTTLALHAIAEAQKTGGIAAIVDAEHALDPLYVKALGVDLKRLLISQPDYGEQALEIVDELVRSNAVDLIVVDSVAALVPRLEIEGSMGEMQVGLQARLMSQALRKIAGNVSRSKTIVIFTNQIRMRIGSMYSNLETTAGGLALKFYATMRIDVRRSDVIKDGSESVGITVAAKVVKNKVAPPFKKVDIDIVFGKGVVRENELFNLGVSEELIQKKGNWYFYVADDGKEYTLGQGKNNVILFLAQNPRIAAEIERKIRLKYNLPMGEKDEKNR